MCLIYRCAYTVSPVPDLVPQCLDNLASRIVYHFYVVFVIRRELAGLISGVSATRC